MYTSLRVLWFILFKFPRESVAQCHTACVESHSKTRRQSLSWSISLGGLGKTIKNRRNKLQNVKAVGVSSSVMYTTAQSYNWTESGRAQSTVCANSHILGGCAVETVPKESKYPNTQEELYAYTGGPILQSRSMKQGLRYRTLLHWLAVYT